MYPPSLSYRMVKVKHLILSPVDYTTCSTDNNCVSILIDYGKNVKTDNQEYGNGGGGNGVVSVIDRNRMVLSERYTSQKQFIALKSKESFYSVLKFKTGAVIVVGLKETGLTDLCVVKAVASIADTLEYPISIKKVSVVNRVSTFNRFNLNFHGICSFFQRHCLAHNHYPETFPGMFFKIQVPRNADDADSLKHLGAYYMQAALECREAANEEERNEIMNKKFIVKRILVFKVGKYTVLGKSARDDVSIESRLLFGFFHYFMDNAIKMSEKEILDIRRKYNIPPLEWFLFVDIFLHTNYYNKPSIKDLRKAMLNNPNRNSIDSVYYGNKTIGDNSAILAATMSNNIIPPISETLKTLELLKKQKITARYDPEVTAAIEVAATDTSLDRFWWVNRKSKKERRREREAVSRHEIEPLLHTLDRTSVGRNSEWMRREHSYVYNKIRQLVDEELKEKMILARYRQTLIENHPPTIGGSSSSSKFFHGNRCSDMEKIRHRNRERIARLTTHLEMFKFLNKEIVSGSAPELAKLFGTDVYSLLNMITTLPLSTGHYTALRDEFGEDYNLTPGVAFFNKVLRGKGSSKRKRELIKEGGGEDVELKEKEVEEEDGKKMKKKKYTPSDFIEGVTSFEEEGISKIGLDFNIASIIETLNRNDIFVPSDRPTANYRTSLHANSEVKSILKRLLNSILEDADDMTEEEVEVIRNAINPPASKSSLSVPVERHKIEFGKLSMKNGVNFNDEEDLERETTDGDAVVNMAVCNCCGTPRH
nr:MAG: wsv303-like protein [Hemigrapsus takanoi nimavirus]